jgi:hypothetical protein
VSGSALIGALASLFALRWNLREPVRAFLTVGICGGFTTFSTFALDSFYLFERGQMIIAALCVGLRCSLDRRARRRDTFGAIACLAGEPALGATLRSFSAAPARGRYPFDLIRLPGGTGI